MFKISKVLKKITFKLILKLILVIVCVYLTVILVKPLIEISQKGNVRNIPQEYNKEVYLTLDKFYSSYKEKDSFWDFYAIYNILKVGDDNDVTYVCLYRNIELPSYILFAKDLIQGFDLSETAREFAVNKNGEVEYVPTSSLFPSCYHNWLLENGNKPFGF